MHATRHVYLFTFFSFSFWGGDTKVKREKGRK